MPLKEEHLLTSTTVSQQMKYYILRRGLSKTFGKCKKVFLLFPAIEENLKLYVESEGFPNRLARIGSELRGGAVVEVDSNYILEFPAHALHVVFTTEGGFLAGINYSTVECLPVMARMLDAFLTNLTIAPKHTQEDLEHYLKALSAALQMQLES
ncbi:hypothetical protein ACEPPN_016212 [Leptodophora sp. 'Broadleaf-Isolate-01']